MEYNQAMKLDKVLVITLLVILLIVTFLTFHDFFEPHTLRDWLTLVATVLVFLYACNHFLLPKRT